MGKGQGGRWGEIYELVAPRRPERGLGGHRGLEPALLAVPRSLHQPYASSDTDRPSAVSGLCGSGLQRAGAGGTGAIDVLAVPEAKVRAGAQVIPSRPQARPCGLACLGMLLADH